jgi:hypothetical protein
LPKRSPVVSAGGDPKGSLNQRVGSFARIN